MNIPIGLAAIGLAAIVALVVVAELGRLLVAKLFGYQAERHAIPIMKLPGSRGTQGFRLALILAGPVTCYLAIAVLAFAFFKCHGTVTREAATEIAATTRGFDAADKLAGGDVIVEVDGAPFAGGASTLSALIDAKGGAPISLTVERAGAKQTVSVTPTQRDGRWLIGVVFATSRDHGTGRALREAIGYPATQTAATIEGLIEIVTGSENTDAGGQVRLVEEFRSSYQPSPSVVILLLGMTLGGYTLIALALFDLFRALLLILFRS